MVTCRRFQVGIEGACWIYSTANSMKPLNVIERRRNVVGGLAADVEITNNSRWRTLSFCAFTRTIKFTPEHHLSHARLQLMVAQQILTRPPLQTSRGSDARIC